MSNVLPQREQPPVSVILDRPGIRRQWSSLVSGHFQIVQAGYDPVESSSDVFRRAAALLVRVLVARTESYTSERLRELVESLASRS